MTVHLHQSKQSFTNAVLPLYGGNEALYCVEWSELHNAPEDVSGPDCARLTTVTNPNGETIGAAILGKDGTLSVSPMQSKNMDQLLDALKLWNDKPTAVRGARGAAKTFARGWVNRTSCEDGMRYFQVMYRLQRLAGIDMPQGKITVAKDAHLKAMEGWVESFRKDCEIESEMPFPNQSDLASLVAAKRLYVWEHDGLAKSMVAILGNSPKGAELGLLFTPQEFRGNGFASGALAALCKHLLSDGSKQVSAILDEDHKIPNHVFRKVGFDHMGFGLKQFFEYS